MSRFFLLVAAIFCLGSADARVGAAASPAPETIAGKSIGQYAEQLADPDRVVRLRAARSLGAFGEKAGDALRRGLDHDDAAVRYVVAVHLGRIGGQPLELAQQNLDALAKDNSSLAVQIASSYALCCSGEVEQHLPLLIESLNNPIRGIACSAAELIGQIGPAASQAIDALNGIYKQNEPGTGKGDSHLGGAAQNALRKIQNEHDSEEDSKGTAE